MPIPMTLILTGGLVSASFNSSFYVLLLTCNIRLLSVVWGCCIEVFCDMFLLFHDEKVTRIFLVAHDGSV